MRKRARCPQRSRCPCVSFAKGRHGRHERGRCRARVRCTARVDALPTVTRLSHDGFSTQPTHGRRRESPGCDRPHVDELAFNRFGMASFHATRRDDSTCTAQSWAGRVRRRDRFFSHVHAATLARALRVRREQRHQCWMLSSDLSKSGTCASMLSSRPLIAWGRSARISSML